MEKEQEVMVETAEAAAPVENTAKRKSNASVPVDQFDWDSFEEDSSEADRKADEEKYNQTLSYSLCSAVNVWLSASAFIGLE